MGRLFKEESTRDRKSGNKRIRSPNGSESIPRSKDRAIYQKAEISKEAKDIKQARRIARFQKARENRFENKDKIAAQIATIDFETDPFEHGKVPKAFACGFATSDRYEAVWGSEKEVLAFAREKVSKFEGYVYAHNGGKFDFPEYLLRDCGKMLRGEKGLLINGRLVKLQFGRAEIRDSYAVLPAPLSAFDKGVIDIQWLHKSRRERYRGEILDYLKRDCQSLHTLVVEFVLHNGIKAITAASAAMASMRELCQEVDCLSKEKDAYFRKWYFGGRVQVFKPGITQGKFTDYDIKSAYPHAMLHDHAISSEFRFLQVKPFDVKPSDFVFFRGVALGCFPSRTDKGLSFPTGEGEFYVTGHEFIAARELGLLGKGRIEFIERPTRVGHFKEYVNFHYQAKERAEREGNKALRLISKILINSGYGKLAQDPEDWRDYIFMSDKDVIPDPNPEGWEEEVCNEACGYAVWSRPAATPGNYYNVAAAASITGFVRARLMRAIHETGAAYCDTDSITVPWSGRANLALGEKLGDFTKEYDFDLLLLGGKKLYAKRLARHECRNKEEFQKKFGDQRNTFHWWKGAAWKIASKGAKLTPAELLKICHGKSVTYHNAAPSLSVKSFSKFVSRTIRATVPLPAKRG